MRQSAPRSQAGNVEIELKARLDDSEPARERLSSLGSYARAYEKADAYWIPADPGSPLSRSGIRVRRDSGVGADGAARESALVTTKDKALSGGIEVNEEREFAVSDPGLFEDMLRGLGLAERSRKSKRGWEWEVPPQAAGGRPIRAEVSMVGGLGWFLELEIVAGEGGQRVVEESRGELYSLLEKLGVPIESIEPRPYSALLELARQGGGAALQGGDFHGGNGIPEA